MSASYQGSCLCGAVRYTVGTIAQIIYCHCARCRKAQGTPFASNGFVDAADFCITVGEDKLTAYESSPGSHKYFCSICGSPVYSQSEKAPEKIRIRLGLIDDDITERPTAHIFVGSKANWETITGELPQYEYYEPARAELGHGFPDLGRKK